MGTIDPNPTPCSCEQVAPGTNFWWAQVLIVSVVAMVLRASWIGSDSLWFDEAITVLFNRVPAWDLITGRVYDLGNPPLYWILAGLWSKVFGDSETGLRSFPALCGVLTVPFLAMVGRRLVSPSVGLWGALLLAISPTAIELSNEARPYSLLGLLAVVATWFFVRWVSENRGLDLALYALVVFLVCSTHYYGGAVPLAHAASLLALRRERRRLRSWFAAMAVAGILGLPVLHILVMQIGVKGNLSRMSERWVTQFLATPMVFGLGRNLAWRESPAWLLAAVTLSALIGFWLPALSALYQYHRNSFGIVLLGAWSFIPIVVPLIVAATLSPLYETRYAFVGLPGFLLLTAWGLKPFRPSIRGGFSLAILVLSSMSLYCYATRPLKDDWRSATQYVLERWRPGESVVFEPDHEIETFLFYASRYTAAPPEMIALTSGPGGEGRLAGVRFVDGVRSDRAPRDCTDSVSSSSGIWLVLCVPREAPEFYRDYFGRIGFRVAEHQRSHRIQILHFVRQT